MSERRSSSFASPPLPAAYLARMRESLGADGYAAYLAAMEKTPPRALRVNTSKTDQAELAALLSVPLTPTGLTDTGLLLPPTLPVGRQPAHAAGLFYMQEASAQVPASLPTLPDAPVVLDLCAAPGGKASQLAARMRGGVLFANEPVPERASVLAGNLERMGVSNAVVTNLPPERLCPLLKGLCDVVLVDAPCAGEGMFRREPEAVRAWSPAVVSACAKRQARILALACMALKAGGQLVYSTCSFSEEENEQNVRKLLLTEPSLQLVLERRLYPQTCCGEGQYMALLQADGTPRPTPLRLPAAKPDPLAEAFLCESLAKDALPSGVPCTLADGRALLLPPLPCAIGELKLVRAGLLLGETQRGRFLPAHALALCGRETPFLNTTELNDAAAESYLTGECLPAEALSKRPEKGYCAVLWHNHALGLGKFADEQLKNHYPKGLRSPLLKR